MCHLMFCNLLLLFIMNWYIGSCSFVALVYGVVLIYISSGISCWHWSIFKCPRFWCQWMSLCIYGIRWGKWSSFLLSFIFICVPCSQYYFWCISNWISCLLNPTIAIASFEISFLHFEISITIPAYLCRPDIKLVGAFLIEWFTTRGRDLWATVFFCWTMRPNFVGIILNFYG